MFREVILGLLIVAMAKPIISPIAFATVLAVSLYPIYSIHKRKYFAILLVSVSVLALIYIFYSLFLTLYDQVIYLTELYSTLNPEIQVQLAELGSSFHLRDFLINLATSLPSFLVKLIFFVIFSYFFLIDGHKIREALYKIMPREKARRLADEGWKNLRAVVSGVFVTMFIYILISTFLLYVTRCPSPLLYSIVAALFGVLPIFAAWMVYIYLIYLKIMEGQLLFALLLAAFQLSWNTLFDFIFKMKYRGTLHPAILLGSMISGMYYFGFSGIIVGPMMATGLITLAQVRE